MIEEFVNNMEFHDDTKVLVCELERLEVFLKDNNLYNENSFSLLTDNDRIRTFLEKILSNYDVRKIKNKFIISLIEKYKEIVGQDENYFLLLNKTQENRSILVERNYQLVTSIASMFANNQEEFEEYRSCGSLALLVAIDKFDVNRNCKFSTYAYSCIDCEILKYIRKNKRVIRIPDSKITLLNKYKKFTVHYYQCNGVNPSKELICEHLCITEEDLDELNLMMMTSSVDSLNRAIYEDENDVEVGDFVSDSSVDVVSDVEARFMSYGVSKLLDMSNLTDIEKFTIIHQFGLFGRDTMTFTRIAEIFNVSSEFVRSSYSKALRKMHDSPYALNLASFLDVDLSYRTDLGQGKLKTKCPKNLYGKYSKYSVEEINVAVSKLPDEFKKLIYKRYGDELDRVNSPANLTKDDSEVLYKKVFPLLEKLLKHPKLSYEDLPGVSRKNLFERLSEYSREDVISVVLELPSELKDALILRFGNNYDSVFDTTNEISSLINFKILPFMRRKLEKRKNNSKKVWDDLFDSGVIDCYEELQYISELESFEKYAMTIDSDDDRRLLLLVSGYLDGLCYELSYLKDYRGYDLYVMDEALKCLLFGYKLFLEKNDNTKEVQELEKQLILKIKNNK